MLSVLVHPSLHSVVHTTPVRSPSAYSSRCTAYLSTLVPYTVHYMHTCTPVGIMHV